ncbi:MAG: hypothetical protein MUF58_12975 [Arcicella sp.]|jgi:hypothetical protein|nr:hypothetical protein [Arcicella sp.]
MPKFITVLNSDLRLDFWKAIQVADSLPEAQNQIKYIAGNREFFDKQDGDKLLDSKEVEEENTGRKGMARIIKLAEQDNSLASSMVNINKGLIKAVLKKNNILILLAIAFLLNACSYSGRLTRRYAGMTPIKIDTIGKCIGINSYVIEKEKPAAPPKKTIFDLTSEAQKELIKQIGINETLSTSIIKNVASSLSLPSTPNTSNLNIVDMTVFTKTLVITTKNLLHFPANRISKMNINLKFDDRIKLLSCNKLTTDYQSIDIGKLNYSNSNSAELTGNLSSGLTSVAGSTGSLANEMTNTLINGTNVTNTGNNVSKNTNGNTSTNTETGVNTQGLTGKLSASRSFAEEVWLKQRIVTLSASITNNTLSLYQDGISGVDLTGNIITDIVFDGNSAKQDVVTDTYFSIGDLTNNNVFNDAAKLKITETIVSYFNFTEDITATISFNADYRHVISGDNTITESDDKIQLLYGSNAPQQGAEPLLSET